MKKLVLVSIQVALGNTKAMFVMTMPLSEFPRLSVATMVALLREVGLDGFPIDDQVA